MCKRLARLTAALLMATTLLAGRTAAADSYRYDFALQKMFNGPMLAGCGGKWQDPQCQAVMNSAWRSLMSQMGVIFAPQFLAPSETTGWNGFVFNFKYGLTTLDSKANYWKYGVDGSPQPVASTVSFEVRKGIWMPLPSFELGGGFTHLVDSHMFSVNLFAKFALHEGFLDWPTPALAVRGTFQRIVGTHQVDFTILSTDVSISKAFGIAGSFNLTPYVGYNIMWIIAKSGVIDGTPNHDALQCSDGRCNNSTGGEWDKPLGSGAYCNTSEDPDCNAYYVFFDQKAILRHRVFFGLRLYFTVSSKLRMVFATEYSLTIKGLSNDSVTIGQTSFPLKDDAPMQHTWGISVGIDY